MRCGRPPLAVDVGARAVAARCLASPPPVHTRTGRRRPGGSPWPRRISVQLDALDALAAELADARRRTLRPTPDRCALRARGPWPPESQPRRGGSTPPGAGSTWAGPGPRGRRRPRTTVERHPGAPARSSPTARPRRRVPRVSIGRRPTGVFRGGGVVTSRRSGPRHGWARLRLVAAMGRRASSTEHRVHLRRGPWSPVRRGGAPAGRPSDGSSRQADCWSGPAADVAAGHGRFDLSRAAAAAGRDRVRPARRGGWERPELRHAAAAAGVAGRRSDARPRRSRRVGAGPRGAGCSLPAWAAVSAAEDHPRRRLAMAQRGRPPRAAEAAAGRSS